MAKSPDAFRTISEVAEWLDRPAHVLRFWESKFTQVKPVKRAGGRRYYRPQDMLLLGGIKRLLHDDGMTIKGVQKLLRENGVQHVAAMSQPLDPEEELLEATKAAETSVADKAAEITDAEISAPEPVEDNLVTFPLRTDSPAAAEEAAAPAEEADTAGDASAPQAEDPEVQADAPDQAPVEEAGFAQDVEPEDEPTQTSLFDFVPEPDTADLDVVESLKEETTGDASAQADAPEAAEVGAEGEVEAETETEAEPSAADDADPDTGTPKHDLTADPIDTVAQEGTDSPPAPEEAAAPQPRVVDVADDVLIAPTPGTLTRVVHHKGPVEPKHLATIADIVSRYKSHSASLKEAGKKG